MRTFLQSAVLTGLLLTTVVSVASAGTFLQEGAPQTASAVQTYGMHASIPVALHTVVPKGWTVIVAPGLALSGRVSWAPTDTWIKVVARMAKHTDAGFIVDWDDQKLLVRSVPQAMQFVSKLALINQQATAPLPAYSIPKPTLAAAAPVAAKPAPVPAPPKANEPPAHSATALAKQARALRTPASAPEATMPSSPVQSFADQSAEQTLQALADHYQLHLKWHGPDFPLPGPVTFLFHGLREDVLLLDRALGPVAPLAVTYYEQSRDLVVRHALYSTYLVRAAHTVPVVHESLWADLFHRKASSVLKKPHPAPLAVTQNAAAAPALASAAVPLAPVPLPCKKAPTPKPVLLAQRVSHPVALTRPVEHTKPVAPMLVLDIAVGDRLSTDLDGFLRAHGWQLSWQVPNDLKADDAGHIAGKNARAVLGEILPLLGLTAQFNPATHVVIIQLAAAASVNAP